MIKIQDRNTVYYDVDETLINNLPMTVENCDLVIDGSPVNIIQANVDALFRHKEDGDIIVVWSYAGSNWAEKVVKALNLVDVVDLVISKPYCYYDDMHCSEFMGEPRHLGRPND